MASKGKKGGPTRPGKAAAPASKARVERRKKGAGGSSGGASQPKVGKGSEGTGRKGGGLH